MNQDCMMSNMIRHITEMELSQIPFTVKEFYEQCEPIQDLPFGELEEEYSVVLSMMQMLKERSISLRDFLDSSEVNLSLEFRMSPLFQILNQPTNTDSLSPFQFRTRFDGFISGFRFSPEEFLDAIVRMTADEPLIEDYPDHPLWRDFIGMLERLYMSDVNILDFISSAMPRIDKEGGSDFVRDHPLLGMILHTATANESNVMISINTFEALFLKRFHLIEERSYLSSKYDYLDFTPELFMTRMREVERIMHTFDTANYGRTSNFVIPSPIPPTQYHQLHVWIEDLDVQHVDVKDFLYGHEPAPGSEGAIVFGYLMDALELDPEWPLADRFLAHVKTGGSARAFLDEIMRNISHTLTRSEATALVDRLETVDMSTLAEDDLKCPCCLDNFGKGEEGEKDEPVRLPCSPLHLIGRDCLIKSLTATGRNCPFCRADIVAMITQTN